MNALALATVATAIVGCTANEGSPAAEADIVKTRPVSRVSGFDFSGPKALPTGICRAAIVHDEIKACDAVDGVAAQAEACAVLCSKPIARPGSVAGFDFSGFRQAPSRTEHCDSHQAPEEARACAEVGGVAIEAADCAILCTKPIAKRGHVAGYDSSGFNVLASDKVAEQTCAAVVSAVRAACDTVHGETRPANGCRDLCSLPL